MTIKGQALANFIVEFTYADAAKVAGTMENANAAKAAEALREKNSALTRKDFEQWTLYMDDASNDTESRADIMLISPEGHKIHCALRFRFEALNNEAKYEALIAALYLAK